MGIFDETTEPAPKNLGLGKVPLGGLRSRGISGGKSIDRLSAPAAPGVAGAPGQSGGAAQGKQLPFIAGVGQTLLKALMTSGASGIAVFDEATVGGNKPIDAAGKNVSALWGPQDVFEPGAWEKLKTGESVLKDRFGWQEQMIYAPEAAVDLIAGGLSGLIPGLKQGVNLLKAVSDKPGEIALGTNTFWAGLGLDIATDPLTYGTAGVAIPFRAGASAARNALKAGRLAAAGEVAEKLAKQKSAEILNQRNLGISKSYVRPDIQSVRENIIKRDPKAAETIKRAEEKLVNNAYKTVRITEPRTLSAASKDIIASAMEAGVKAASNAYTSLSTARFLEKYAKRDVKRRGRGIVEDTAITPATTINGARQAVDQEALVLPDVDGNDVTLNLNVPHEADNGKTYLYDGENVTEFDNLADANNWLQIQGRIDEVPELEPVISGKSGNYKVRVGERVTTFKTKKEATAYAESVRTGQMPDRVGPTTGRAPIIDTVPPTIPVKEALKAPSAKEATALRAVLKGIDEVAKKTSGWRPQVNESVSKQIVQALSGTQARLDRVLLNLKAGELQVIKEFLDNPSNIREMLGLLEDSVNGSAIAAAIRSIPLETSKGVITLGDALVKAKGKFLNLTEVLEGSSGNVIESQALNQIKIRFYERAQQLKTKAVLSADSAEGRYQAVLAVAGEEIANRIRATGYLDKPTEANVAKVKNIIEEVKTGTLEVSYQGYDDLIAGLKRGDEVSANALEEIFNLIDPEGGMRAAVAQAAGEPAASYLTRILTREGGVNTIYEAERRLAMAGDVELILKHPNLSYDVEIASLIKLYETDKRAFAESLDLASTKQAFAESFEQYPRNVQRDAMDSAGRSMMGDPKDAGQGGVLAYRKAIEDESRAAARTSTLGDAIYATEEAYTEGSKAMFAKNLNQSAEQKIISSLLGKMAWRLNDAKAMAAEVGGKAPVLKPAAKLDYLIEHLSAARDGMGGLGFRYVRTKNRDDITFEKSYQAEIQKAKKTKTTPNFSAYAQKHTVYLPMADILTALKENGATEALVKGFFPSAKSGKEASAKSLDWLGLGDAARRVLEVDSAGEVFDLNEITQRILRRGANRAKLTPARQKELEAVAAQLAEALTEPQTVAALKAVHLDNAASIVQDFVQKAEDYSKDLMNILYDAFITMHAADNLSEAARMNNVRMFFRKFTMASDILRIEGGPIAEAMFRASAMLFASGGKVLPEGKITEGLVESEKQFFNLLRDEEMTMFREALVKWYRYADIPTAPAGREGLPVPKRKAQDAAQEELDFIMDAYARHMDELAQIQKSNDPALIRKWESTQKKLQVKLDKAREKAWNNWLPTYHWHPTEGWQLTEKFDHKSARSTAEQAYSAYVAGKRGVEDRPALIADSKPVIPPHRVLSRAEKAKFLKQFRVKETEAQIANARSIIDDKARNIADEIDNGALNDPELSGPDKLMIAAQNMDAQSLKETMEIRIYKALATYKEKLPATDLEFNRLYRPLLDPETPVLMGDRVAAKLKLMAQRWSATTRGTGDAITIMRGQENMATQISADYMAAMDDLVRSMNGATIEDLDAVWTSLRADIDIAADAPEAVRQVRDNMAPFVNAILRSELDSVIVSSGIDGRMMADMFRRYGLDDKVGFPGAAELENFSPSELVNELFNRLPFGAVPKNLDPTSIDGVAWLKNREKFRQSELPMPLVFSRLFSAVQHTKAEQGIAHNLVSQFGWKQHFKSMDDAVKAGWVKVEAVGKDNIARFLPDADGGNLFHPAIAENIGRMFREWNAQYESGQLPQWLNASMRFMGFLKFTQTTARPGHHLVNMLGDGSTMILGGLRNPRTLLDGADIAGRFTRTNFAAEYGQLGRDFEAKAQRLAGALNAMPGAEPLTKGIEGDTIKFTFYRDGKPKAVEIDRERFAADLGNRGVLVPGFVQTDLQGYANEMMLAGTTAGKKRALSKVWSKVARPGHELMRGLSTFTSAYSNVIRASTAVRVAQSRAWSSYEEMMNAVLKEVNLLHPTVQSLASSEKRWGRLIFTYYTWLRVAHNALWDLAVNHTGAMLAIPKLQYNYAQMQGFEPQSPAVPFENLNALPDYISYSVYGPTQMAEQGPRTVKPPLILLDVLDFWKISYDPSKDLGTNIASMGGQLAGNVVGPSLNILGQPILRAVTEAPGGPQNLVEAGEDALSNLGFMNLLTGLGAYTPYRYRREDTTNPLTDADRKRILDNWLFGARAQDIYRPINIRLGESQYGSRLKAYNEKVQAENKERVNQFVNDKLSEGYTQEQIIEMLKGLGVK